MVRAGIDKIKLIPPEIKQVDMELVKVIGEVVQSKPEEFRYLLDIRTGKKVGFNKIEIRKSRYKPLKSNLIELINYNTGQNILPMISYERVELNLPRQISEKEINNENINNYKDFNQAIKVIEEELKGFGFGELDLKDSEVREIEINYNIPISKSFNEYERVINYIASLRSGYLKVGKGFESDRYTGLTIGNKEWNIKIYDKKTDIKNKTGIDIDETLRIEFTFKTTNKINSIFGDNKIKTIIKDDFEEMQRLLKEKILDDLVERIYKDVRKQVNHAIEYMEKHRRAGGGGNSVDEYLKNHQANLIDSEIILETLRTVALKNHYARECRRAIKSIEDIEGIKLFGNINKLNEILDKLGYKKIAMNITPTIKKEIAEYY